MHTETVQDFHNGFNQLNMDQRRKTSIATGHARIGIPSEIDPWPDDIHGKTTEVLPFWKKMD
jgi:hypothetical protein